MTAIQKVLCPVDTSPFSRRALQYAVAFTRWYQAGVVALAVRPAVLPPSLWLARKSAAPVESDEERAPALQSLRRFVQEAVGTHTVRTEVSHGSIVGEILRVARELPADLLVIGTHGQTGFDRLLLGSVTEKMVRKAKCPILTIPKVAAGDADSPDVTFDTVVCGVDRSTASRRALRYAVDLAQQASGRLVVVHVLEDVSEEEPRFSRHLNTRECWKEIEPEIRAEYEALVPGGVRRSCQVAVKTPVGKGYQELLAAAVAERAELIVVGATGRSTPVGATVQHVLRAATCPVLSVPPAGTPAEG